jgi:hypothetical protein
VQRAPRGPVIVPDERGPEAARERSVSFRPRGPLSLHYQEHPHDGVPSNQNERDVILVSPIGTDVNRNVTNRRAVMAGLDWDIKNAAKRCIASACNALEGPSCT